MLLGWLLVCGNARCVCSACCTEHLLVRRELVCCVHKNNVALSSLLHVCSEKNAKKTLVFGARTNNPVPKLAMGLWWENGGAVKKFLIGWVPIYLEIINIYNIKDGWCCVKNNQNTTQENILSKKWGALEIYFALYWRVRYWAGAVISFLVWQTFENALALLSDKKKQPSHNSLVELHEWKN